MPIFQDDLDHNDNDYHGLPSPPSTLTAHLSIPRRLSEESLPKELCEGPVSDSPRRPSPPRPDGGAGISCRAEYIERLKRGESPTWIPNRHLESILQRQNTPTSRRSSPEYPKPPSPLKYTPDRASGNGSQAAADDRLQDGLEIERPGSALHSGDFTTTHDHADRKRRSDSSSDKPHSQSVSETCWITDSPPRDFAPRRLGRRNTFQADTEVTPLVPASPLSSSLSSSFAYYPPTSPLVQSESNDEADLALNSAGFNLSCRQLNRRLQPRISPPPRPHMGSSRFSSGRREPYQAHQPRAFLTFPPSLALHAAPPGAPALHRSRRPSFGSFDTCLIQHASMVGSYEESILRGRMSTTPSRPFDFLAQIGVLGKGRCKSSLRCPAHVTLPFPAVYYNYSGISHGRSHCNDDPSPYVGQIDLENGLPNLEEKATARTKAYGRFTDQAPADGHAGVELAADSDPDDQLWASRPKRRATGTRAPPGGSYRIPGKGQIQIVIKNQNKTAVKLFLVPYDLTGMEAGTKTFIRQRSYSGGPIIDDVPNPSGADAQSRPMLRYLVHLHMCCPSKGRFYLYKSIRVVFANRVPEGKEVLRNETTWPEPRFTPYKPTRVMQPPLAVSTGPGASLAADKAFRRRSLGVPPSSSSSSSRALDMMDGQYVAGVGGDSDRHRPATPAGLLTREFPARRPSLNGDSDGPSSQYEKLTRGDFGYKGNTPPGTGLLGSAVPRETEGLLSQRLRSLGIDKAFSPPGSAKDLA